MNEELKWTCTRVFLYSSESPPIPDKPKGEGWRIVSVSLVQVPDRPGALLGWALWSRSNSRPIEPCPGLGNRVCGAVAIKNGRCVGCGRARER